MRNIPTLPLSSANLLLKELESRGSATVDQLLDVPDVGALFESGRTPPQPPGRVQELLRYATYLDLARLDGKLYSLTDAGRRYADAVDVESPWMSTSSTIFSKGLAGSTTYPQETRCC